MVNWIDPEGNHLVYWDELKYEKVIDVMVWEKLLIKYGISFLNPPYAAYELVNYILNRYNL
jgi:hypothetical protein